MDPLLGRIAERRALLAEQEQHLARQLAEAELERIGTAEQRAGGGVSLSISSRPRR